MKNFKLRRIAAIIGYTVLAVVSFNSCDNNHAEPPQKSKYTIYVGSAAFAVGYNTDSYKDTLGYFTFMKSDGTVSMYKSDKILRVDVNNR
jgi:hypothetical protein